MDGRLDALEDFKNETLQRFTVQEEINKNVSEKEVLYSGLSKTHILVPKTDLILPQRELILPQNELMMPQNELMLPKNELLVAKNSTNGYQDLEGLCSSREFVASPLAITVSLSQKITSNTVAFEIM